MWKNKILNIFLALTLSLVTGIVLAQSATKATAAKKTTAKKAALKDFAKTKPNAEKGKKAVAVRDLKQIVKSGKIVIALPSQDQTLFFSKGADGKLSGYSIDVANEIGRELHVKVVFNRDAKNFDDLINILAEGKADLSVANLSKTTERAKKILYTDPYLTLKRSFLVNRGWLSKTKQKLKETNPVDVLNQPGTNIGVLQNSAYHYFAKKLFPKANIVTYQNIQDAFAKLKRHRFKAIFADNLQIAEQLKLEPGLKLSFEEIVLDDKPDIMAFAVAPYAWNLWQWLNQYLVVRHEKITAKDLLQYEKSSSEVEGN